MSLRAFHLFFILLAIVGADLFGVWAIQNFRESGDALILSLGILSILGGLGLILYAVRLVKSFDRAEIH